MVLSASLQISILLSPCLAGVRAAAWAPSTKVLFTIVLDFQLVPHVRVAPRLSPAGNSVGSSREGPRPTDVMAIIKLRFGIAEVPIGRGFLNRRSDWSARREATFRLLNWHSCRRHAHDGAATQMARKISDLILRSIVVAPGDRNASRKGTEVSSRACRHPSRRSHASACDLLRMRSECVLLQAEFVALPSARERIGAQLELHHLGSVPLPPSMWNGVRLP